MPNQKEMWVMKTAIALRTSPVNMETEAALDMAYEAWDTLGRAGYSVNAALYEMDFDVDVDDVQLTTKRVSDYQRVCSSNRILIDILLEVADRIETLSFDVGDNEAQMMIEVSRLRSYASAQTKFNDV